MAEIERYRKKPEKPSDRPVQVTARYLPPEASLDAFLQIARMADPQAQVYELHWAGLAGELCVRWERGDRSAIEWSHVPAGEWLAYDPQDDFLYVSDQHDWDRWYERVEEAMPDSGLPGGLRPALLGSNPGRGSRP